MYAIIRTGGHQYRVEAGKTIDVERLPNPVDESFEITDVLLVGNGENTIVGQPTVEGARVKVTVLAQERDAKILVYKYNHRTNYRRKRGHRQYITRLRIDEILV